MGRFLVVLIASYAKRRGAIAGRRQSEMLDRPLADDLAHGEIVSLMRYWPVALVLSHVSDAAAAGIFAAFWRGYGDRA